MYHFRFHKNSKVFCNTTKKISVSEISWYILLLEEISQPKSRLECFQCKYVFHEKCQKHVNVDNFDCNFCRKETFPFTEVEQKDLIDLSFNCKCVCICVQLKNRSEDLMHKIIYLKELNFEKTQSYSDKDTNKYSADHTSFKYSLIHDFHRPNKNTNKANKANFTVLHRNIYIFIPCKIMLIILNNLSVTLKLNLISLHLQKPGT